MRLPDARLSIDLTEEALGQFANESGADPDERLAPTATPPAAAEISSWLGLIIRSC